MKKPVIYVAATILSVLIVLLAVPFFIPWAKYKDLAISKIAESSGYYLTIGGDISGGLLPTPHVNVQKISVASAANTQAFVTADSVSVSVALLPLLSGAVELGGIVLDKPVVTLAVAADGQKNWEAVKPAQTATPATEDQNAQPKTTPPVSIGKIQITNGLLTYADAQKDSKTELEITDLVAHVPSLQGPFAVKGDVSVNKIPLHLDIALGDLSQDIFKVKGDVTLADNALNVKLDGQMGLKPTPQGEMAIAVAVHDTDALAKAGLAIPIAFQDTKFSGDLKIANDVATLSKGEIDSPLAKAAVALKVTGLQNTPRNVAADIVFQDALNIDALLKALPKTKVANPEISNEKSSENNAAKMASDTAGFLPDTLNLPKDLTAKINLSAPSVSYKDKLTGALNADINLTDAQNLTANVALANIPGGGEFKANGGLSENSLALNYALSASSLQTILVDWLAVAKAEVFNNPNVPKSITTNGVIKVAGKTASLSFDKLVAGDTTANGMVTYTKAAHPVLGIVLRADTFNLVTAQNNQTSGDSSTAVAAAKTVINPPKLPEMPFDVAFDVAVSSLNTTQATLRNIIANGKMAGQAIELTKLQAELAGGTVSAVGRIADVSSLKGVDLTASLNTPDIKTFVASLPTKVTLPDTLKGPVSAKVNLAGDRMGMQVNGNVNTLGFNATVKGGLADVLNPVLPGTLAVSVTHPDFDQALRQFAPTMNSQTSGGLNVTTDLQLGDETYTLNNLKAKLGNSDLNGQLKIKTSPLDVSGNLASSTLDLGGILGVTGTVKQAALNGISSLYSTVQASGSNAPWSSAPLPLSALKGLNTDVKMSVGTLTYGTWRLTNATFGVVLNNGALDINPLKAGLFGGELDMRVSAKATDALNVSIKGSANNVQLGAFLAALASQKREVLQGKGSVDFDIAGAGASSAALVRGLNGKLTLTTQDMSVLGIDLEKLGAAVDAATDGGWQGALSSGLSGFGLEGGSTGFKDMTHSFPITNGVLSIADLKLDTRNALVRTTTNGQVHFPNFALDTKTDIFAVKASRAVANINFSGPLNAPQKQINSDALQNLLGSKVQKQLDKVIQSDKVQNILNKAPGLGSLLGIEKPAADPQPAPTTPDAAPAPQAAPVQKPVEQQVIEGLFNQFGR